MLATALGPDILAALQRDDVTEIMLNADGQLWVEEGGLERLEARLSPAEGERIIRLVASHVGQPCDQTAPILSAELPGGGERFEGLLPPLVTAPVFSVRKPAKRILFLSDYVSSGILSPAAGVLLADAVQKRQNIIVVGGTGSGKTTLTNALMAEIPSAERLLLLEDTRELQVSHPNHVRLRTFEASGTMITLRHLVRSTLRLRPDRIIVGEVRGAEALDLLKSWNTGHPGGLATLHAGSAAAGLIRLEQLIGEASQTVPRALVAETVDLIVVIEGRGTCRRVREIAAVTGVRGERYSLQPLYAPSEKPAVALPASSHTHSPTSKG